MAGWREIIKLKIRYGQKYCLQKLFLPGIYKWYNHNPIEQRLVLFADAKNTELPFSMQAMYEEMQRQGYQVENWCVNFDTTSLIEKLCYLIKFMRRYAQAKYVFICDYFLPVSSCEKRKETKVIQLWHSCGLLKKFGYDTVDDLGQQAMISATKNIDLWPVSADACVPIFEKACHLYEGQVQALGVSRTDIYFSEEYRKDCVQTFYQQYPDLQGKKLILWAPTFRGNAKTASLVGIEAIQKLQIDLGNDWKILIKVHPHLVRKYQLDNCNIPTEKLYPVVDLLITDYSSVIFDYSLFEKPFLIFAPDYDDYMQQRGCYIDMENELPCEVVKDGERLKTIIEQRVWNDDRMRSFIAFHLNRCDGHSMKRIIKNL